MNSSDIYSKINQCLMMLQNEGFSNEATQIKDTISNEAKESERLREVKGLVYPLFYQQLSKECKLITSEIIDYINDFLEPKAVNLPFESLTLKKEKKLYAWLLAFSILVWMSLVILLPVMLIVWFIGWLGNGLFVAYLKSEAVEVNQNQMPELYNNLLKACSALGIQHPPHMYILQAGGLLNAFATRHCSRNFVVLYSDVLETFGSNSKEAMFILGHELGHIKRKHLPKQLLIMPGLLLPIFGAAYSRACESSCDRYGAFVANDLEASVHAMLAISGGRSLYKELNAKSFAQQHYENRGFFVSLHEITSGYPTLSKRVEDLVALKTDKKVQKPSRHFFAYFFALFSFGRITPVMGAIIILVIGLNVILAMNRELGGQGQGIAKQAAGVKVADTVPVISDNIAIGYFNEGIDCFRRGDLDQAEENFNLALNRFDPQNKSGLAQVYRCLAYVNEDKGDFSQAVKNWKKTLIGTEMNSSNYHAIMARIALLEGDSEAGERLLKESLRIDAKNQFALDMLASSDKEHV